MINDNIKLQNTTTEASIRHSMKISPIELTNFKTACGKEWNY